MISQLKTYPKYKSSGVPWLGVVPDHWEVRPAFGAFTPNNVKNRGMKEKTVLSLSYGRIIIKAAEKLRGLVPESFETYQIVDPGDIVLRTTDLQNDHTSLRAGMVRNRGIITSAYLALRVKPGVNPEFGFQFLNVWDSTKAIYGYGSGLRQNLNFSHFKRMPVALPPQTEQAAIVRFLTWATSRLELAIRSKRKVIALLKEQKQSIIHRSVTRGLDPNVALKQSGVPWLGDIPSHWEVRRVKSCAANISDQTTDLDMGGIYIALENVESWTGVAKPQVKTGEPLFTGQVKRFQSNDVLFGKLRPNLAKAVFAETSGVCSSEFFVLRANSTTAPNFLECIFRAKSIVDVVTSSTFGAKMPRADWQFFGNMKIALPPLDEQIHIAKQIGSSCIPISHAVLQLEREIELLNEYRARLVADVVTGKLDVREAAVELPEDTLLDATSDVGLGVDIETLDEEASE